MWNHIIDLKKIFVPRKEERSEKFYSRADKKEYI